MKKIIIAVLVIIAILIPSGYANAADSEIDSNILNITNDIDFSQLDKYFKDNDIDIDAEEFIIDMTQGDYANLSTENVLSFIFKMLANAAKSNVPAFIMLFVVVLIISLLRHFTSSFEHTEISGAGIFAGNIIIASIIAVIVFDIIYSAQDTVSQLSDFISVLSPILLPLLIALGGYASNAVLTPAIASFNSIVVVFFNYFIFPVILICVVLSLVSSYSKNNLFNGISDFLQGMIKWLMGIVFVIFLGILVIQGTGAAGFDGISIRTAKYTIDKTIPVVGGMFSDSFDTMIICSSLVKNAVGITGLIICGIIVIVPAMKIIANILIFKAISAFLSPYLSENNLTTLKKTTDIITLSLICVLIICIMVFMLISMIIGAGNINIMMR